MFPHSKVAERRPTVAVRFQSTDRVRKNVAWRNSFSPQRGEGGRRPDEGWEYARLRLSRFDFTALPSALPVNLVAADVRRLHLFREISQSLLTSAATVQGFKARTAVRRILSPLRGEGASPPPKLRPSPHPIFRVLPAGAISRRG